MPIAKYNGEKVVRCGGKEATPYLRKNFDLFKDCKLVLDLACGEGRNSRFLRDRGIGTLPFDRCPDYGMEWKAEDALPVKDQAVDGVLLNYFLMFLTLEELQNVAWQVDRVAKSDAIMMVELEVVKSSYADTPEKAVQYKEIFTKLLSDWDIIKEEKLRFIARKR